ncbi:MAG: transglutaminase family protein [Verrucomicrobiae bacterium]|nr:transglutaminase family protein [Verrucomicrobiae bacterium]
MSAMLSEKQKNSLFRLLSDDDPSTLQLIKDQLFDRGNEAAPQYEEWIKELHGTPAEAHLLDVLHRLKRGSSHQAFLNFCARLRADPNAELEEACFLLASTEYPATDMAPYRRLLDEMAGDVRLALGRDGSPSEIRALSQVIHEKHRFRGNRDHYYEAENTYLNRMLERRLGIPLTLSLLYLLIGRRLDFDVQGVALPGHFIVSWRHQFYDPYHQGQLLDEKACREIVASRGQEFREAHLAPASHRQILLRMLMNLSRVYELEEDRPRLARIRQYLRALNG